MKNIVFILVMCSFICWCHTILADKLDVGDTLPDETDGVWINEIEQKFSELLAKKNVNGICLLVFFAWGSRDDDLIYYKKIVDKYKKSGIVFFCSAYGFKKKDGTYGRSYILKETEKLRMNVGFILSSKFHSNFRSTERPLMYVVDKSRAIAWIGTVKDDCKGILEFIIKGGRIKGGVENKKQFKGQKEVLDYIKNIRRKSRSLKNNDVRAIKILNEFSASIAPYCSDKNVMDRAADAIAPFLGSRNTVVRNKTLDILSKDFRMNSKSIMMLQEILVKLGYKKRSPDTELQKRVIHTIAAIGKYSDEAAEALTWIYKRGPQYDAKVSVEALHALKKIRTYRSMEVAIEIGKDVIEATKGKDRDWDWSVDWKRDYDTAEKEANYTLIMLCFFDEEDTYMRKGSKRYAVQPTKLVPDPRSFAKQHENWDMDQWSNWIKKKKDELVKKFEKEKSVQLEAYVNQGDMIEVAKEQQVLTRRKSSFEIGDPIGDLAEENWLKGKPCTVESVLQPKNVKCLVMLVLPSNDTTACKTGLERLKTLQKDYQKKGAAFLVLSGGDEKKYMLRYIKRTKTEIPTVYSPFIADKFTRTRLNLICVLGKNGNIQWFGRTFTDERVEIVKALSYGDPTEDYLGTIKSSGGLVSALKKVEKGIRKITKNEGKAVTFLERLSEAVRPYTADKEAVKKTLEVIRPFLFSRSIPVRICAIKVLENFRMDPYVLRLIGDKLLKSSGKKGTGLDYQYALLYAISTVGKYDPRAANILDKVLNLAFKGEQASKYQYRFTDIVKVEAIFRLGEIKTLRSIEVLVAAASRLPAAAPSFDWSDPEDQPGMYTHPYKIDEIRGNLNKLIQNSDTRLRHYQRAGSVMDNPREPFGSYDYHPELREWLDRNRDKMEKMFNDIRAKELQPYLNDQNR